MPISVHSLALISLHLKKKFGRKSFLNRLSAIGLYTLIATQGHASEPLTAIDWLKDPAPITVAQPLVSPLPDTGEGVGIVTPGVEVTAIETARPGAAGLLPASSTGLPTSLWTASTADTLIALIARLPSDPIPAMQSLYYTLLLAETEPPADATGRARFLNARLDTLRRYGAVEPALALTEQAGPAQPELFEQWLDLSLLSGAEAAPCSVLSKTPNLTKRYDVRIYCAAQSGDWATAALTYDSASALGLLDATTDALLAQYLDPELADATPGPKSGAPVTPLLFRLYETAGAPLPTRNLSRDYAVADLRGLSGWKAEIEAAERLTRTGALPANQLLGLYTQKRASASGGVWDRVRAVQALDLALSQNDRAALNSELPLLWQAMRQERLAVAFATLFAERLSRHELTGRARIAAFEMALLSPDYQRLAQNYAPVSTSDQFLLGLVNDMPDRTLARSAAARAVADAFASTEPSLGHSGMLSEGRLGQAILSAALQLDAAGPNQTTDIFSGLSTLRAVGLDDTARRAALQILLLRART